MALGASQLLLMSASGFLVLSLLIMPTSNGHKLERFYQDDVHEVDPEVRQSLVRRQPRFFLKSSTTITSTVTSYTTLSTSTACYTSNAPFGSTCARRRKRALQRASKSAIETRPANEIKSEEAENSIKPSRTVRSVDTDTQEKSDYQPSELSSGLDTDLSNHRDPRFLVYYTTTTYTSYSTTTSTSTTTTGTTTFTLASCTPSAFSYSAC